MSIVRGVVRLLRFGLVAAAVVVAVAVTALVVADWRAREHEAVYVVEVPFTTPGSGALTAGRIIFIHRDRAEDSDLLAHELVHVCQWEEEGLDFLWGYSREYVENAIEYRDLREAYREVSFEQEARLGEVDCDLENYLRPEE